MFIKKSVSRIFAVLIVAISLLLGVLAAQAETPASSLAASGSFVWAKSMGGTDFAFLPFIRR